MLYCLRKKKSLFSLYYTSRVILLCTNILELLKLLLLSISLYVLSFFFLHVSLDSEEQVMDLSRVVILLVMCLGKVIIS